MTHIHPLFLFEREFDEFLYAPIGEEKNGMVLSVVSALARRGVDPWQEAARLSRLPRNIATQQLCAMIAELPPGAPNRASPRSIAERLMTPLPLSAGSGASSSKVGAGGSGVTQGETLRWTVFLFFLLLMMAFSAVGPQSAAVVKNPAPSASVGGSPPILPSSR